MTKRLAKSLVMVVGRDFQLGAAVFVAAKVPKLSVAHSIVLLGAELYRQKDSTRSLRTLKTKTDTVLRTLKKQGQTVLSRQRVMAIDTVKKETAHHTAKV